MFGRRERLSSEIQLSPSRHPADVTRSRHWFYLVSNKGHPCMGMRGEQFTKQFDCYEFMIQEFVRPLEQEMCNHFLKRSKQSRFLSVLFACFLSKYTISLCIALRSFFFKAFRVSLSSVFNPFFSTDQFFPAKRSRF